jgi:hypothetical protein
VRWILIVIGIGGAHVGCKEKSNEAPRPMAKDPRPDPSIKQTMRPLVDRARKAAGVIDGRFPNSAPCKVPVLPFNNRTTPMSVDEPMQFSLPAAARPRSPDRAATVLVLSWRGKEYDLFGLAYSGVTFEQIDVATETVVAVASLEIEPLTSYTVDRDTFKHHNDRLRQKVADYVSANCK